MFCKGGLSSETYHVNQHYWWEYANCPIDKMVLNEIKVFANTAEKECNLNNEFAFECVTFHDDWIRCLFVILISTSQST